MATTAPIDVERYLLQGELLEAAGLKPKPGAPPAKPPLEDALLNAYNKSAPTPLKPGELPPPVELAPETVQAGKTTLQKTGEFAARIPGQIYEALPSVSMPSFGGGAQAPTPSGTVPQAQTAPATPGTIAAPAPQREYSPGFYGTLQRHANFVRDVAEFGGKTLAGMGAFAFGAATAVSDILNAQLARVAGGGPSAGGPESSTHYRDIFTRMDKTISDLTPEPRSDTAKTLSKGVGAVTGLIKDISELPGKGLVAAGILNEDTARVLSFGAELYLFYKIDRAVRQAAPELRSKIAEFKTRMSKAKTDSEVADIANDLANAASKNPRLEAALDEARGKFRDEADREAGAAGPREPSPEGGPAGGGAEVELVYDPAELQAYRDSLQRASDQFDVLNPEGASIWERRDYLEKNVPKPQGRPKEPTPPAEAARPAPAPEAPRAQAAPTAERPVQPEVVVGQEASVARTEPIREYPGGGTTTVEAPRPTPTRRAVIPETEVPVNQTLADYIVEQLDNGASFDQVARSVRPHYRGDISNEAIRESVRAIAFANQQQASTPQAAPIQQFQTARGSEYTMHADGTTSRNKAPRPEHPGDFGPQPKSEATFFLSNEDANKLSIMQATNPYKFAVEQLPDGRYGVRVKEGPDAGRFIRGTIVTPINEPTIGMLPIELWKNGEIVHFGNEVTRIGPPEAAATVAPETVPAPVSPETPAVAAVQPSPARKLFDAANAAAGAERTSNLAQLKSLAKDSGKTIRAGLEQLGFTPDEVSTLETQLRKVRAKKAGTEILQQVAEKPAVQTAATEAVLENAAPGTEVEIPAPSEPIVDTSPVIEKPKRKRRVVKAAPETVAEQVTQPAPTAPTGEARYYGVRGINMLQDFVGSVPLIRGGTTLPRAPIQVRATEGAKPDAIFIDTSGLSTRTKWQDIDVQQERGRMSEETANALRENLRRQAELSGKLVEEAHTFTGEELTREATRIAAETGIDLYVKKGKNYELVPKDVVRTDARLNRGDDLAPTPISAEAAGAYAESKTSDIGPAQIRAILAAVERGEDISAQLPSELLPHYQAMRDNERAGIDTSERRAFIDILTDLYQISRDILENESGAVNIYAVRMATQRLQADMRKAGKTVREFLFGARPEDVAMFEAYLDRISNPAPPDSTNPRNMRFDPENIIPGDRVVKQRVISSTAGTNAVPLWQSEVRGIQGARDIKPGGTAWDVKLPLRQHKAAGTEFLYYAYRTAQKNLNAELNDLHAGMEELSRGFSSRSLENIGANGYQRQGGDGQRILTYNKVTPRPMTPAERRLQATIDGIYADLFNRINETRVATGREPLPRVDDYQTFARTISLLNRLGIQVDLARDTVAEVNAKYAHHKATNFPYIVRKHAFYTAEMNALKILDTYAQAALKDIHMSPFLAKMHELIETKLPDPVTGKETWSLKDNKPGLYNELRRWTDYLATGTNLDIPATQRIILQTLNSNIAYATLSYLIRSAGIQVSTLVNTNQALGTTATAKAIFANLADHLTGGKQRQFALDNSEILSSRKFIDAYNQVAGAIIGRRPRDFFHAVRTGALSDIQKVVGNPGFKLLELFDMEAAVMSWNAAYKQARGRAMNYAHKDAVRFADDLVVRTQGSTMPGDLAGVQRNALGKLVTQFQTFLISDWNFLTNEVLTKGKIGGGGGGQIPPGGVASGSGSWETGGPRSNFQMVKNIMKLLIATQLVNEFYKLLHIQPAQPDPVEDVRKGIKEQHGPLMLAWDIAVGQAERLPFVGGMRYGKGITGPAIETARDLARSYRGDPLSPPWWEPTATAVGVPVTRQISKTVRAVNRGENIWDSLMGWYSQERGGGRERGERRERRSR